MLSSLIKRDRAQRFHNFSHFRQFSHFRHLFIALYQSAIARGESNKHDKVELEISHLSAITVQDIRKRLKKLGNKKDLWERRISIMSTFHFVKRHEFSETLKISKMLLFDRQDLIQKATGWMLREIGKRRLQTEESFLKVHYKEMLRYAIEKFPEQKRQRYLKGRI